MAKHKYTDTEARLALETYFREAGLDYAVVRSPRLAHLVVLSVGRVYLRHWSAIDAAGVTHLEGPEGPDGPPSFIDGYDLLKRIVAPTLRWQQRARWYQRTHGDRVRHVVDWLDAAVHDNADWLGNVDDKSRPKKLMKCGSIEALGSEADKAMTKALQASGRRRELPETDERVVLTLGELSLVRLLSPLALDAESAAMRHCIGLGAYDGKLGLPGIEYYSVRDFDNRPLATVEIIDGVLVQCAGRRNERPSKDAFDFIAAIRTHMRWISSAEHSTYYSTRHELIDVDLDRIATAIERGDQTYAERLATIERRAMQVPEGVAVDELLNILLDGPRRP